MSRHGHKLNFDDSNLAVCPESKFRYTKSGHEVHCIDLDEESKLPDSLAVGSESYESFKNIYKSSLETLKKALITGITGQDGSYLSELLLEKGYQVHGLVRRSSSFNRWRIEHLIQDDCIYGNTLFLHYADLNDDASLRRIFSEIRPDEVYHLAGQSHVGISFEIRSND